MFPGIGFIGTSIIDRNSARVRIHGSGYLSSMFRFCRGVRAAARAYMHDPGDANIVSFCLIRI